jgi:hypothetical protein
LRVYLEEVVEGVQAEEVAQALILHLEAVPIKEWEMIPYNHWTTQHQGY